MWISGIFWIVKLIGTKRTFILVFLVLCANLPRTSEK